MKSKSLPLLIIRHLLLTPVTTSKKAKKAAVAGLPPASSPLTNLIAATSPVKKGSTPPPKGSFRIDARLVVILNTVSMLFFVFHYTWVTFNAYPSASVVLASQSQDGSQYIIDDFRRACYRLRKNAPETVVVMSWWDYGYQIAGMADRPTPVDNNTWNNSKPLPSSICIS